MRKTTKMAVVLAAMSVMVLGAATMVSAAEKKNGWVKEGSDWYYYVDDKAAVNQWALSGSDWFFLGEEGKMETEEFILHDSKEKAVIEADTINYDDEVYYVGKDGAMVTGWLKFESSRSTPYGTDGETWYYFGTSGVVYTGQWVLSGNLWYYLDDEGVMVKNDFVGKDDEFYVNKDGAMITGWYQAIKADADNGNFTKDAWVYAGTDGKPLSDTWKKVNGSWYYFGTITGGSAAKAYDMNEEKVINDGSRNFYLKASGAMATGWIKKDKDVYYWADGDGILIENGMKEISKKWYAFESFVSDDSGFAVVDASKVIEGIYADLDAAKAAAELDGVVGAKYTIYKLGTATKTAHTNVLAD